MDERLLSLLFIVLISGSMVVLPAIGSPRAMAQEVGGLSADGSLSVFTSELEISEIRLYNFVDNSSQDMHGDEPTLSSVPAGSRIVVHGLTINQDYQSEHFDYITEVFDSSGVVVHLDVRHDVASPLSGQVGIDSAIPVILQIPGTYTIKVFGLSDLQEASASLLAVGSRVVQVDNPPGDQQQDRPNIVVIMTDDLDQRTVDILLDKGLMPNLKSHIIDQAVTFSESFASFPLCCPSRATFLTGQYAHNHNVLSNSLPDGGVTKLDDSSTLATWLQGSGYYTSNVGKYLNGYGNDTPQEYVPPGWTDWQTTAGSSTYWMYGYTLNDNGVLAKYGSEEGDYQTDVVAKRSVEVINERESSDSTPFFLYINPLAPHEDGKTTPCELNYGLRDIKSTRPAPRDAGTTEDIDFLASMPPSFNEEDTADKPLKYQYVQLNNDHISCLDTLFHARLESMLSLDDLIGDVANALTENNEENTILVFTSDNGFLLGEHRLHGKQFAYEESIRVPLYMRIPEVASKTIDALVINNDLAPTFLEFAGVQAGLQVDGRSLVPLIKDPTIPWRNGFLIEAEGYSAIRAENYIYVYHFSGAREIYDLDSDPYQLENLASEREWWQKNAQLDDWRAALEECEGTSCKTSEDREAP